MKIYVDGVEEDSALISLPVFDSPFDWYFADENSFGSVNYTKIDISSVQKLWFEPNILVNPTNVPDRSGNGNVGTINWGSNPAGFEVTFGALTSGSEYISSTEEDIADIFTSRDYPVFVDPSESDISSLPMYHIFLDGAESLGWTTAVLYGVAMIMAAVGMGFGVYVGTGSLLFGGFGVVLMLGMAASTPVVAWWLPLIISLILIFAVYSYRRA